MQRARLPQTRAKGEYEMENTIKVLQHKESKLSGECVCGLWRGQARGAGLCVLRGQAEGAGRRRWEGRPRPGHPEGGGGGGRWSCRDAAVGSAARTRKRLGRPAPPTQVLIPTLPSDHQYPIALLLPHPTPLTATQHAASRSRSTRRWSTTSSPTSSVTPSGSSPTCRQVRQGGMGRVEEHHLWFRIGVYRYHPWRMPSLLAGEAGVWPRVACTHIPCTRTHLSLAHPCLPTTPSPSHTSPHPTVTTHPTCPCSVACGGGGLLLRQRGTGHDARRAACSHVRFGACVCQPARHARRHRRSAQRRRRAHAAAAAGQSGRGSWQQAAARGGRQPAARSLPAPSRPPACCPNTPRALDTHFRHTAQHSTPTLSHTP
jgi:hypothetical protein